MCWKQVLDDQVLEVESQPVFQGSDVLSIALICRWKKGSDSAETCFVAVPFDHSHLKNNMSRLFNQAEPGACQDSALSYAEV